MNNLIFFLREITEDDSWFQQTEGGKVDNDYFFVNEGGDLANISIDDDYVRIYVNGNFFGGYDLHNII